MCVLQIGFVLYDVAKKGLHALGRIVGCFKLQVDLRRQLHGLFHFLCSDPANENVFPFAYSFRTAPSSPSHPATTSS